MNGKAFTTLYPRSFVGITLTLTDSDVRTFLEGEEEKPKVTYSVALVLAFLAAKNENRQLEDLPQADF